MGGVKEIAGVRAGRLGEPMVPALEPDFWFKVNELERKKNAGKSLL